MSILEDAADVAHACAALIVLLGFYYQRPEKIVLGVTVLFTVWLFFALRERHAQRTS